MKCDHLIGRTFNGEVYVLASEAMEAIAELKKKLQDEHDFGLHIARCADHDDEKRYAEIAQLQAMLEERNKQVAELKDSIAPKQSDKTLQERLNEVCKKHGVSTLQDLDWAFCESEKRHTKDNIDAAKILRHHKYKRCLDKAKWCDERIARYSLQQEIQGISWKKEMEFYRRLRDKYLEFADKFKEKK